MAEVKKRIIVEGIDYQHVLQFPRLLRAASMALQPGRMVIGLLMVTALITFGQVWDAVTVPNVSPAGLQNGSWDPVTHGEPYQNALRNAMVQFSSSGASNASLSGELERSTALAQMQRDYEQSRAMQTSTDARRDLDVRYAQALATINEYAPRGIFEATSAHLISSFDQMIRGLWSLDFRQAAQGARRLFIEMPLVLWRTHPLFTVAYGLLTLLIFAIGGGAISRMTAIQLAIQQRLGVRPSLDFSLPRWWAFFSAQLLPLALMLALCVAIMVLGVLMVAPVLNVIGALLYGVALLLGLLLAFLALGFLVGHPMLVPAVACENGSGPDAMQRTYAYVVTRPLHLIWYWLVALAALALGFLLVSVFAALMLNATARLFGTLVANPAMPQDVVEARALLDLTRHDTTSHISSWHQRWSAGILRFWETLVICLVAAYVLSFHFTASTIGYLLMRRAADGQDIDEVWQAGKLTAASIGEK